VDVARDEQHHAALADQLLRLGAREPARVGQAPRDLLDAREVPDVLLGRDDRHHHVLAQRRLAQVLQHHPRRGRVERLQVRLDLAIVGEGAVGAVGEAEELGGRRHGRGGGSRAGRAEGERQDPVFMGAPPRASGSIPCVVRDEARQQRAADQHAHHAQHAARHDRGAHAPRGRDGARLHVAEQRPDR
jgi:hypothetical protein